MNHICFLRREIRIMALRIVAPQNNLKHVFCLSVVLIQFGFQIQILVSKLNKLLRQIGVCLLQIFFILKRLSHQLLSQLDSLIGFSRLLLQGVVRQLFCFQLVQKFIYLLFQKLVRIHAYYSLIVILVCLNSVLFCKNLF